MKPEDKTTIEGLLNIISSNSYIAGYNASKNYEKSRSKLKNEYTTVRQALLEYIEQCVEEAEDLGYAVGCDQ
jgi:hypothetical protein